MKILGIDSSGNVASVALVEDDKILCEQMTNYKLTHSQTLMPMIDRVCKECDLDLEKLDAIAVASGPGSFTGLRIGAATGKGLALGLNIPIISVPTLDGLAYNMPHLPYLICPIMDARRKQVYTALYRWENSELKRITDYKAISIENLVYDIKERNEKIIFIGDGVPVFKEYLLNELKEDNTFFAPPHLRIQRGSSIGLLGIKKYKEDDTESHLTFAPFYLRKSQAEREREEKNANN